MGINLFNNIIKNIEKEENVKILFLVESGSRAWKWESEDSDFDLRGVYLQKPNVFGGVDQIDKQIQNLDISLWSLEKFLKLFVKSNPTCWEWLSSDIIYRDDPIRRHLEKAYKRDFSQHALQKHYVSMARGNFNQYIKNIDDKASLKKYTYILRSIACVNYIEIAGAPPPKDYKGVINYLPENVKNFMNDIIIKKRKSESIVGKRNREVEKYVINYWDMEFTKDQNRFDLKELNNLYNGIMRLKF